MKRVQGLLDFADDTEALRSAVDNVVQGELGDAGGIQPLREKAAEVRGILSLLALGGNLNLALGEILEVLVAGGLLGKPEIEIAQGGFEGPIAHHGPQHVKEHRALVHHHGAVVG
jgi:hypothetical protein